MRETQKLKPEFSEYVTMLVKLFNQVVWQDFYEDRSNEEEAKAEKRTVSPPFATQTLTITLKQGKKKLREDRMKPRFEVSLQMNRDNTADLLFNQTLEYVQGEKQNLNKSG